MVAVGASLLVAKHLGGSATSELILIQVGR
jgi:hypothetical protein